MDAEQFDQIVHGLARASTRRIALAGLMGTLSGGLGLTALEQADAKRKRRKRKNKNKNGTTPPPPPVSPPPVSPPPPPIVCADGTKACGSVCIQEFECCGGCGQGETCCKGICANLATDGQNCGICGNVCETDICVHGACDCLGLQANCPAACACSVRRNNVGTVCTIGNFPDSCTNDDECELGSVCMVTNACSRPCNP